MSANGKVETAAPEAVQKQTVSALKVELVMANKISFGPTTVRASVRVRLRSRLATATASATTRCSRISTCRLSAVIARRAVRC